MPNQSAEQLFMQNNKTIAELLESIRNAADDHFGDAASAGRIAEMLAEVLAVVESERTDKDFLQVQVFEII